MKHTIVMMFSLSFNSFRVNVSTLLTVIITADEKPFNFLSIQGLSIVNLYLKTTFLH
jgi:hypothetical protein